jgi:hypothetical protein
MQRAVKAIRAHFQSLAQTDKIENKRWKILWFESQRCV